MQRDAASYRVSYEVEGTFCQPSLCLSLSVCLYSSICLAIAKPCTIVRWRINLGKISGTFAAA